jgi:hypothetical protein
MGNIMLTNHEAKTKHSAEVKTKVKVKADSEDRADSEDNANSETGSRDGSETESTPKYSCWNCNNTYSSKEYQIFHYCSDTCEDEHSKITCYCGNQIASDLVSREYQLCEEHAFRKSLF